LEKIHSSNKDTFAKKEQERALLLGVLKEKETQVNDLLKQSTDDQQIKALIEKHANENASLSNSVAELESTIQELSQENEAILIERANLDAKLEELQRTKAELKQLKDIVAKNKVEFTRVSSQLDECSKKLKGCENTASTAQSKLMTAESDLSKKMLKIQEQDSRILQLEETLKNSISQASKSDSDLNSDKTRIEEILKLKQEKEILIKESYKVDTLEKLNASVTNELKSTQDSLNQRLKDLEDLKGSMAKLSSEVEELRLLSQPQPVGQDLALQQLQSKLDELSSKNSKL